MKTVFGAAIGTALVLAQAILGQAPEPAPQKPSENSKLTTPELDKFGELMRKFRDRITIAPHRGDGAFKDLSLWVGPLRFRGYQIDMPKFDLAHDHNAAYHIRRVPDIGQCDLYFTVEDPKDACVNPDDTWKKLDGSLSLKVTDSAGNVLVEESGKLGDYIWSGQSKLCRLYQLGHSEFSPDPTKEYCVQIAYSPDPKLAGYRGYVTLECPPK